MTMKTIAILMPGDMGHAVSVPDFVTVQRSLSTKNA